MTEQLTEPLPRGHESFRPKVERVAEVARELPLMELEERRAAVTEIIGGLRMGYGRPVKPTPRRPLRDVVQLED